MSYKVTKWFEYESRDPIFGTKTITTIVAQRLAWDMCLCLCITNLHTLNPPLAYRLEFEVIQKYKKFLFVLQPHGFTIFWNVDLII